jgi:hypothetical protein
MAASAFTTFIKSDNDNTVVIPHIVGMWLEQVAQDKWCVVLELTSGGIRKLDVDGVPLHVAQYQKHEIELALGRYHNRT